MANTPPIVTLAIIILVGWLLFHSVTVSYVEFNVGQNAVSISLVRSSIQLPQISVLWQEITSEASNYEADIEVYDATISGCYNPVTSQFIYDICGITKASHNVNFGNNKKLVRIDTQKNPNFIVKIILKNKGAVIASNSSGFIYG